MLSDEALNAIIAELGVELVLYPENGRRNIKTFAELESFVNEELSFWGNHSIRGLELQPFNDARNRLNQGRQQSDLQQAKNLLSQAVQALRAGRSAIYSSTADGKFLASLTKTNGEVARGALDFLRGLVDSNAVRNSDYFVGVIRGVLHRTPNLIAEGINADIEAVRALRAEINGFRNTVSDNATAFKTDLDVWKETTMREIAEWYKTSRKTTEEAEIARATRFGAAESDWNTHILELEKLYEEKLALEAPVRYWKSLERSYTNHGKQWVRWAVFATFLASILVAVLLYWPPRLLLATEVAEGIRGVILAGVAISLTVYVIHLLVRLATSSYHLARDARERRQLTLVFLALLKRQAVQEKDRQVVLAALFSRADTGLLKHDSGQTFPGLFGAAFDSLRGGRH